MAATSRLTMRSASDSAVGPAARKLYQSQTYDALCLKTEQHCVVRQSHPSSKHSASTRLAPRLRGNGNNHGLFQVLDAAFCALQ